VGSGGPPNFFSLPQTFFCELKPHANFSSGEEEKNLQHTAETTVFLEQASPVKNQQ
jgi:hypothetical protein